MIACLVGCNLSNPTPIPTLPNVTLPTLTVTLTPAPTLYGDLTDENAVMSGICFEGAYDARGRVFVIKTDVDHINFYNQADNARLCRRVVRYPFDFSSGTVLAGVWSYGIGCTASHQITAYERDDTAKTIRIVANLSIEGDCPYELIRPLWLGIPNARDYDIALEVVQA